MTAEVTVAPDGVLQSFTDLLADHDPVRVSAVSGDGTPVPVPAEVPLPPSCVLSGTAGMKAYVPADRVGLIDAFDRVQRDGRSCTVAHTIDEPDVPLRIEMFDLRPQYGVIIVTGAADADPAEEHEPPRPRLTQVPSRLARVYKSRTAEVLAIDEATTEMLGWAPEDMVGRRSLEFIHVDDQGLAIENWAVLLSDPTAHRRVRIRHRTRDGEWRWVDVAHAEAVFDGEPCLVADIVDVSREMESQQLLEARERLLERLAQALPLGVFQVDSTQRFRYTNQCLFDVMGTSSAETFEDLLRWVSPADKEILQRAMTAVLSDGVDDELSVLVTPDGGEPRVCQFTVRQLAATAETDSGAVGCVVDITEKTTLRRELEDRATFDSLTRCLNRETIMSRLEQILESAEDEQLTAVMFVDLDRFKSINDRFGHHIGDEFLAATSARIQGQLREGSAVGRLGGDEFLIVMPGVESEEAAVAAAERVADSLREPIRLGIGAQPAQASIGLAVQRGPAGTAESLVNHADTAMYAAKAVGAGGVVAA